LPELAVGGERGYISIVEVVMRPPDVFVRSLSHPFLEREETAIPQPSAMADAIDHSGQLLGVVPTTENASDHRS
jgi:hypothetical protein